MKLLEVRVPCSALGRNGSQLVVMNGWSGLTPCE